MRSCLKITLPFSVSFRRRAIYKYNGDHKIIASAAPIKSQILFNAFAGAHILSTISVEVLSVSIELMFCTLFMSLLILYNFALLFLLCRLRLFDLLYRFQHNF